jgi:SHS2 domain-containing protein
MSALSEVDLRDFERVDVDTLEKVLNYAESEYILPFNFQEYCDTIRRIQKKLIQQTPALFKP